MCKYGNSGRRWRGFVQKWQGGQWSGLVGIGQTRHSVHRGRGSVQDHPKRLKMLWDRLGRLQVMQGGAAT